MTGCPLVVLRHGPTQWTEDGRIQGRANPPLSASGRALVRSWMLPPALRSFDWQTSPLVRAVETASLLGASNAAIEPRLVEMDWGAWEGRRLSDLRAALGAAMAAAEARGPDFRPPGGESPRMVQRRLRPWLRRLGASGRPVVAVAHKGIIRALLALATGWDMHGAAPAAVGIGTMQWLHIAPDGTLAAERLDVPCRAAA